MVGRVDENLMMKLLEMIPEQNMSVHQICCRTGIDHRTVKKYIQLIIHVQNSQRLKLETVGLRVLVRREKPDSQKTHISEIPQSQTYMR